MKILRKFARSFKYCAEGIVTCVRTERNFRTHIVAMFLILHISLLCNFSNLQYAVLLLTICGVLVAEIFNTAIEALVDLETLEINGLAKIAKDVAAGAVGITAIFAILVGYFLFIKDMQIAEPSVFWWVTFAAIAILGIVAICLPTEKRTEIQK